MIESWTGTIVNLVVVEKCMDQECRKKELFSTTDCPNGNFHGCFKTMECSAVISLFERSEEEGYPFNYTVYVGDGDSNVIKRVLDRRPSFYGDDITIEKEECVFHYRKRVKKHLTGVFTKMRTYTVKGTIKKAWDIKHKKKKPLDYSTLSKDDFVPHPVFSKERANSMAVRFANLVFIVLEKTVDELERSR